MKNPFDSLRLRAGETGDHDRVMKDWTLGYATSDFARYLTPRHDWMTRASQLYWDWQKDVVRRLLKECDLWVAYWEEAPTSIIGWCVLEDGGQVVHYVAVGPPVFRLQGVAKKLLAPALEHPRVIYTHRTLVCRHLPIPPNWTFDPRRALERRTEAAA